MALISLTNAYLSFSDHPLLDHAELHIEPNERVCLVGRNGAGKSTLLKLICGILKPYKGKVEVNGTIAPLIELGAGLDPQFTARENIFLNGALLGHKKSFMQRHFDEIIDFAELHDFVDSPIKNFSSGMSARLGFSIATVVKPDILVVDEVLAVGDSAFRKKCENRMSDMLSNGTTLLFVSHSANDIKKLCQNVIWLNKGETKVIGKTSDILSLYENRSGL
mgnify:CR=1 FL=1